jgi:hypothetical protein
MNEGRRTDRRLSTQRSTQLPAGAAARYCSPGRLRKDQRKLANRPAGAGTSCRGRASRPPSARASRAPGAGTEPGPTAGAGPVTQRWRRRPGRGRPALRGGRPARPAGRGRPCPRRADRQGHGTAQHRGEWAGQTTSENPGHRGSSQSAVLPITVVRLLFRCCLIVQLMLSHGLGPVQGYAAGSPGIGLPGGAVNTGWPGGNYQRMRRSEAG